MIRLISICVVLFTLLLGCAIPDAYQSVKGTTMGTTYSVIYQGHDSFKSDIDELLVEINNEVSTFISSSDISKYNQTDSTFEMDVNSQHFLKNWEKSIQIYNQSDGYFDPSLMPLINYWGFGYKEKVPRVSVDSTAVSEMMKSVGLNKIEKKGTQLIKPNSSAQLDFSAIAKGYAVDAIAQSLHQKKVKNYLVEVGREVYAKGQNPRGGKWKIGINTPLEKADLNEIEMVIEISNNGVASSGNYRNFYIVGKKKYGHTINPHSGYPSLNDMLATTVVAENSMTADAHATGFMAMGLEKAIGIVEELENVEACFFYSDKNGAINKKYSNGFIQYVAGEK
ncbi:MAG: FAD:protein FMN transferase [Saprospiraceae bacterium]